MCEHSASMNTCCLCYSCIHGLLDSRVVVLVTHQIQFALPADKILLLKEASEEISIYENYDCLYMQNDDRGVKRSTAVMRS